MKNIVVVEIMDSFQNLLDIVPNLDKTITYTFNNVLKFDLGCRIIQHRNSPSTH